MYNGYTCSFVSLNPIKALPNPSHHNNKYTPEIKMDKLLKNLNIKFGLEINEVLQLSTQTQLFWSTDYSNEFTTIGASLIMTFTDRLARYYILQVIALFVLSGDYSTTINGLNRLMNECTEYIQGILLTREFANQINERELIKKQFEHFGIDMPIITESSYSQLKKRYYWANITKISYRSILFWSSPISDPFYLLLTYLYKSLKETHRDSLAYTSFDVVATIVLSGTAREVNEHDFEEIKRQCELVLGIAK